MYLQVSKFTDFYTLIAMYLNFSSFKGVVWDNSMRKPFSHFNYIPIPFSVLWDRRAGTMPGTVLQKVKTTIPHCAQTAVSRFASCPTYHSVLGKKHFPLWYTRWTKTGVLLWVLYYLHFLVQKDKSFMAAWIRWLLSPFLLLTSHTVKGIFAVKVSKILKFHGLSKKLVRTFT